jgi:uncharacterized membrane protein
LTAVSLLAACGGADTTVATRNATTVGAVTHELKGVEFEILDSPLLAVEFDDGTQATASATVAIFEDVGMGQDVLNESAERITWGGTYLVLADSSPDTVTLEELSDGEWTAVAVEE